MVSFPKVLFTLPFFRALRGVKKLSTLLGLGQISRAENCSVRALSRIRAIMLDSGSEPCLQGVLKLSLSHNE